MGSSMFWMNVTVVPEWRGVLERPLPQCQGWFLKLNEELSTALSLHRV